MIGNEGEVDPSKITERVRPEKKLNMREQGEVGKPIKRSLEIRTQCHTVSIAIEMSGATTLDFTKTLKEDDLTTLFIWKRLSMMVLTF